MSKMSRTRWALAPKHKQGELRKQAFRRDRGVCLHCGLDCHRIDRIIRHFRTREGVAAAQEFAVALGLTQPTAWNAHHRIAVADGGEHDLSNIVTLCCFCHERAHGGPAGDARLAREVAAMEIEIPEEPPA